MAAKLPVALDFHQYCSSIQQFSDRKPQPCFTSPQRFSNKRFTKVFCASSSSKSPSKDAPNVTESQEKDTKSLSLSEQLKPLSSILLPDQPKRSNQQLLSKPKSIWVNPAKPRPSVLSLQRHRRSGYSYNPQIRDLKLIAGKLNKCNLADEASFLAILEEIPRPPTRENALLLLNSLRRWHNTLIFFNWIKTQNSFPIETIFYNVTMKSLKHGMQFQLIEELANEMIEKGVELDNITYSTIISCAKRCKHFDKAVFWFERMYKTGFMPDEVTYSAVLDVYAKLGKVEEAISLYERGRASGWKPDPIAFTMLGKMFGDAGDYDGIRYVLDEMKSLGVKPNLAVYKTVLVAMGKVGKPALARSLFEEMIELGITPDEKTLTALIKIYGKARWARDATQLWERMKTNGWPMDLLLYNALLNMCADLGLEQEAEKLFEEMKGSEHYKPDSWSYTAMLNVYGSGGKDDKAMKLLDEMSVTKIKLNVMGCTCLIPCLGKAKRIDDLVMMFETCVDDGIKPDDRLCGSLLSVLSKCSGADRDKVLGCLNLANPKIFAFVKYLDDEEASFATTEEEFKDIFGDTAADSRTPICNCLIDICWNRNLHKRAHELLYLGTVYGLYPGLHTKTPEEWRLNVRSLSAGAAKIALEEWMGTVTRMVERQEDLPELLSASTGSGIHKLAHGLRRAFASHIAQLAAPFRPIEQNPGLFVATREDVVSWVQARGT